MLVSGNKYTCLSKFVFDGDTLNLDFQGEQVKVRLQWMDCPETRKPGQNSTDIRILKHWEWADKS